eukprot:311972-Prymnesium_polylepis.1
MKSIFKKSYFVAQREAWLIPHRGALERVRSVLSAKGYSKDEMDARYFYNFDYFAGRVPRAAPPPSILYWRVRAVYKFFGPLQDPETGKPFFNDAAWKKANN